MLEKILDHLHNWFQREIRQGTYTVENGSIALPFLLDGQYFRITGSVFNDGLHQYPAHDLTDETFEGAVWALAVPKALVDLSNEIEAWEEKNGAAGTYVSESFQGYSYTRATNQSTGQAATWQDTFRGHLNHWRKL